MQQRNINKYLITISCLLYFCLIQSTSLASPKINKRNVAEQPESVTETLNEIGSWPFGSHKEVAIDETRNFAFVNSGGAVLILDISNITLPVLVNDLIRTKGVVKDIYYNSTKQNLYVTLGQNGLEIWDVENINLPQLLSSLLLDYYNTVPPANKMAVKPGYIFIAAEYAGIITVNVSDPANPFQSSFNLGTGGTKYAVSISEDGSFLVAASVNLTELFTVNPNGSITLSDIGAPLYGAWEMHISGYYSFQILQGTLYVLDLSSSGLPVVSFYNLPGNSTTYYSITSSDNILYVSDPFYGIELFDIANPSNPILLGSYQTNCNDIKYFANHVFVPDNSGMNIFDVADPANPTFKANYEGVGGLSRDVKYSGNYCYLNTFSDLYVIDISDPVIPVLTGMNAPSTGADLDLVIRGNYAYITNTAEGLRVVDISDPTNPTTVWNSNPIYYNRIAGEGNYLYITTSTGNYDLKVFDISNPELPVEVGSLTLPAPADLTSGIDVLNGYVYLTVYQAGLKIIDVSDPANPNQISQYNQIADFWDVNVYGNYAYVTNLYFGQSRVHVFDISDPLNPEIIGTRVFSDPPPQAWKLYLSESYLFVGDLQDPYLSVVDVSNPSIPTIISDQVIADIYSGIDVTDNYIFLATQGAGLHIYENPYGIVPVELTSFTAAVDKNNVMLSWQTATETNNSGFEIQRGETSDVNRETNWERIGFVQGNGTTTKDNYYSFVDKNLEPGNYSYKLVQIDFDGTRNESEIVEVDVGGQPTKFALMQNYPNPFNPSTTIEYSIPQSGNVSLKIFNTLGAEVANLVNEYKQTGSYKVKFDGGVLSSGIYLYQIKAGNFIETKKMILMK